MPAQIQTFIRVPFLIFCVPLLSSMLFQGCDLQPSFLHWRNSIYLSYFNLVIPIIFYPCFLKYAPQFLVEERNSTVVMQATNPYPQCVEWNIYETIGDIRLMCYVMAKWKSRHVRRGANQMAHQIVHWIASGIISDDYSFGLELLHNLICLYESFDPP